MQRDGDMTALAQQYEPESPALNESERKYLLDADAARAFWEVASAHLRPQYDDCARPVAYSRTTYYDTPDLSYYRSCRGEVARRLRVREYAHAPDPSQPPLVGDRCFVELKQSAGGKRSKTRVAVRADEVPAQVAQLAGMPLSPCVATWYRRRALTDDALRLRVTLDDYLLLCRPRPLGSSFDELSPGEILGRGPDYILELKTWDPFPSWLADALRGLPEAVGFSKFNLGMRAVEQQRQNTATLRIVPLEKTRGARTERGQVLSLDAARALAG